MIFSGFIAMGGNTDLSNTKSISVSTFGIDTEFNTTEKSAALMPMKGKTTGANLYEEVGKVLQFWVSQYRKELE
jgi:hypothetical protein